MKKENLSPKGLEMFVYYAAGDGTRDHEILRDRRGRYFIKLDRYGSESIEPIAEAAAMKDWLENVSPSTRWTRLLSKGIEEKGKP